MRNALFLAIALSACVADSDPGYPIIAPGSDNPPALDVERTCANTTSVVYDGTETLTLHIDCGTRARVGHVLVLAIDPATGIPTAPQQLDLVCGNNFLTYPVTDTAFIVSELIAQDFTLPCN